MREYYKKKLIVSETMGLKVKWVYARSWTHFMTLAQLLWKRKGQEEGQGEIPMKKKVFLTPMYKFHMSSRWGRDHLLAKQIKVVLVESRMKLPILVEKLYKKNKISTLNLRMSLGGWISPDNNKGVNRKRKMDDSDEKK